MESFINIAHDNFELELEIEDLDFWKSLDRGDKDHQKLLNSLVFSIHDYFLKNLPERASKIVLNCHYSRSEQIQSLNKDYRNKDSDTDVLSFPIFECLEELPIDSPADIGDIYISLDQASLQAREHEIDLNSELIHLIIHGFFHLIGYDHERSEQEEKLMSELESKMLDRVQNTYSRI